MGLCLACFMQAIDYDEAEALSIFPCVYCMFRAFDLLFSKTLSLSLIHGAFIEVLKTCPGALWCRLWFVGKL